MPAEFFNMSFEETLLLIKGMYDRINAQWVQTRLIAYTIYCTVTAKDDRGSIYDMFQIPGDPSPEELLNMQQDDYDHMKAELKAFNDELRKQNMNKSNGN